MASRVQWAQPFAQVQWTQPLALQHLPEPGASFGERHFDGLRFEQCVSVDSFSYY